MADTTTVPKPDPDQPHRRRTVDQVTATRSVKWLMRQRRLHLHVLRRIARQRRFILEQLDTQERDEYRQVMALDKRIGREAHKHPDACRLIGIHPLNDDGSFQWHEDPEDDQD